ncbi:1,4-dihydroxy-2-naphthoate polyprenyltransferase [Clostridiaceae bacterium 35-E11]
MSLKSFFRFVEIQTKLASVIPFSLGTVYALYRYNSFKLHNFIIMCISLLAFDMATTAINNYIDYKKAQETSGYNYLNKNAMLKHNIKESTALAIIFTLLIIAMLLGVLLTINTNIIVLFIGVISFLVGIFYTFGPIPISRMPLGEIFSGVFMGFVIMFLSIYIHIYDQNIVALIYKNHMINVSINVLEIFYIFLISLPTMSGIANIMLANNICDIEEDIINKRYTLPYYLGKKRALTLFRILYYIGYIDIIILLVLRIAPITTLLALLTLIPVNKNIRIFHEKQIKSETFVLSVKNFVLMNMPQILLTGVMIVIR